MLATQHTDFESETPEKCPLRMHKLDTGRARERGVEGLVYGFDPGFLFTAKNRQRRGRPN
jgi:hypothetical protein